MDQSQDLIMKIAVLKKRLNVQPKEDCCTKVRNLVGKKGDPEAWERVIWTNALKNLESLISLNLLDLMMCLLKASALCA